MYDPSPETILKIASHREFVINPYKGGDGAAHATCEKLRKEKKISKN